MNLSLNRKTPSDAKSILVVEIEFTSTSLWNNGHWPMNLKHDLSKVSALTALAIPI